MTERGDFREFSRQDRYRVMEILLNWEGACNASTLGRLFSVRRENVTRYIQDYRETFPGQMAYDALEKVYKPTSLFTPKCTRGLISEYFDFTRRFYDDSALTSGTSSWLDCGPRPHIEPRAEVFRALVQAIRAHQAVDVRYRSWNHPDGRSRRIHPHALAYSGLRWHCRAYDEETGSFRDFHLGRFEALVPLGKPGHAFPSTDDSEWHEHVDLILAPNPRLSDKERALVEADYGMASGSLTIRVRRSMAQYVLQSYQVDTEVISEGNPRQRPLICANLGELTDSLF